MPSHDAPIARIRLSRSLPRLLGLPTIALLAGIGAIALGLLAVPGSLGLVLAGLGALLVLLAVATVAVLLSVRLEIEEAAVRIRRLGGDRRYELVPGPVTRVRLRGERASSLRSLRPIPGWQLGPARLRGEEHVEVVRLAPTATAILVPTDRGRLAIAAAREEELLAALAQAARARQQLEERASQEATAVQRPDAAPPEPAAASEAEPDPSLMTGIERARYEAELEAAAAARLAEQDSEPEAEEAATGELAPVEPRPARRRRRLAIRRPRPSAVLVLLPLVGAGLAWSLGLLLDRMPAPESEIGRLTALALVLAGPAATIGAIMARIWWPRIVGVVVAGGLAGAVFVGRSLIGG